jgi:hypothetical protein
LQFDFRGLYPLTARSIGSGVSRLQWPMLSWFSILFRGFVSLCCALSILISMDVTPLLRRRLYGLHPPASPLLSLGSLRLVAGWFHSTLPRYASSFALIVPPSLSGSPHTPLTSLLLSPFCSDRIVLVSASCVASPRTYRLSLMSPWLPSAPSARCWVSPLPSTKQCSRPALESTKQFQPSLTLLCIFF